jgi:polar amino acid transport system permease protein
VNFSSLIASHGILLSGLLRTVYLSILAIVASTVLGAFVGFLRAARIPVVNVVLRLYVELFRGSPLLVQLLFIYFGAAYIGISGVSTLIGAFIGLTLYEGAIASEIFRAGVEAVPKAQREAARVLGLGRWTTSVHVVLPQAVKVILPALIGQEISLVKDTSLAAVIGFPELVNQSQAVISNINEPMLVLLVVGALYFIICYPLSIGARMLEKRSTS